MLLNTSRIMFSSILLVAFAPMLDAQLALQLQNSSLNSSACVSVPDHASLEPQTITLEAWIRPLGESAWGSDVYGHVIVGKPQQGLIGSYLGSWLLNWASANHALVAEIVQSPPGAGLWLFGNANKVPVGVATHVAMTYDGTTVKLYVNAVLDAQGAFAGPIYYGNDDVLLGAANFCCGYLRQYNGEMDQVRIWDHARSPEQLASDMHRRLSGNETGLRACWQFDGGSFADTSVNANNGALVGTASTFVSEFSSFVGAAAPRLNVGAATISIATGGSQALLVDAGSVAAGAPYIVVGSLSGVFPGITFGSLFVPLNLDGYTDLLVLNPNPSFLPGSAGSLSATGTAAATLILPAGLNAALAGATAHHAAAIVNAGNILITNPVAVTLVP